MSEIYSDTGLHSDAEAEVLISGELELEIDTLYTERPFSDNDIEIEINSELSIEIQHGTTLDLLPLIPEEYRKSDILKAWVKETGRQFGIVLTATEDIINLLSPNTVNSIQYLKLLGGLLGTKFPPEDNTSEAELKKSLSQTVDWYKLKGSYRALEIVSNSQSFKINIYDMYTNDYVSFVLTDWFVGDEGENPPGLDNTYYKSPHFGLEVILNTVYEEGSIRYLWYQGYLDNLIEQVEEVRPVHTVPHYLILLNPQTDEIGNVIEVDGEIKTKVTSNWEFGTKYFDATGTNAWEFDDGSMSFDSDQTSYIKSITKWVLGIGNYPSNIDSSGATIEYPVLTGTIDQDDITIFEDYYQFEFIVPKAVEQDGISELGLYIPGSPSDKLVLLSTFPKINKENTTELRVVVRVSKSDLSS